MGSAVLAAAATGCSSSSPAFPAAPTSGSISASAGSSFTAASISAHGLRITGGYVPKPASPDVAAAYLTIANTTDKAVRLTEVVTSVTTSVIAMDESDSGGVGAMTDLSRIDVPAHGTYRFVPNHAHLMLQKPTTLTAGEKVSMTLTFTGVGSVMIMLPVVPPGEVPAGVPSAYGSADATTPAMPGTDMTPSG